MNGNRQHEYAAPRNASGTSRDSISPWPTLFAKFDGSGTVGRVTDLGRKLKAFVLAHPLEVSVASLGVGFVVGGGLSFRAGRVALAVAARQLGRELLKQVF